VILTQYRNITLRLIGILCLCIPHAISDLYVSNASLVWSMLRAQCRKWASVQRLWRP